MILAYSVNCGCGQPLLTFVGEEATAPSQEKVNRQLLALKRELERAVKVGIMSRTCPRCHKRFRELTLVAGETKFKTLKEADRAMGKRAEGFHYAEPEYVN
jgi:hypothetical protein